MDRLPPYADLLRLRIADEGDERQVVMPFHDDVVGRPRYLHGGAIAGLMEFAGTLALDDALARAASPGATARPVTVTIDYLRGAGESRGDTRAVGRVTRLGQRLANVEVTAWQADRAKPVAQAHLGFLIDRS